MSAWRDRRGSTWPEVGDLDLSTHFTDWIDRDVLNSEWSDVDQMIIRDYSFEKATQSIDVRDTLFVQKVQEEPPAWTMRDIQAGEEVDTFRANLMVTSLDELSIIGVRPKPPAVSAGLAQVSGTLNLSRDDLADLSVKAFTSRVRESWCRIRGGPGAHEERCVLQALVRCHRIRRCRTRGSHTRGHASHTTSDADSAGRSSSSAVWGGGQFGGHEGHRDPGESLRNCFRGVRSDVSKWPRD